MFLRLLPQVRPALRGSFLGLFMLACGGAQTAPHSAADDAPQGKETSADALDDAQEKHPPADVLYAPPEAVPAPDASCVLAAALPAQTKCEDARGSLASALLLEGQVRDAALVPLEGCSEFPAGLIRALRAELGDTRCADLLVEPVVGEGRKVSQLSADIRETLVALGLGARLDRLAINPPPAPSEHKKEKLEAYFRDELFPWISDQAQAIFVMASQGTHLSGYARGVVAIEAGNADMRFVEIARNAPLADEIASHEEAKDVYYATLDERLEPRKARGRNAALVGLRQMAQLGVRSSDRVDSARQLLSRVYGGRRVNALDTLLVPPVAAEKAEGATAAIASQVPAAYATSLTGQAELTPGLVRAHLQMGMPVFLRREVETNGSAESRLLLARALFESGRTYFRAEDFQAAQALLAPILDEAPEEGALSASQREDAILLRALSVALLAGPKDAADLIANGPRFADALGNLALLDGLATKQGPLGGRAGFNAAYLRELVAPEGAPDYWQDLAERYLAAAQQLSAGEKKSARERGLACQQIAQELRKPRK